MLITNEGKYCSNLLEQHHDKWMELCTLPTGNIAAAIMIITIMIISATALKK